MRTHVRVRFIYNISVISVICHIGADRKSNGKSTLSVWQKGLERMPILYEEMPIYYERLPILSLRMPILLSVNGEIPIFWGTHKIKGAEMRLNN